MDKHLLAENPMSDNGNLAIVRTIQPVSIYEVIVGHHKLKGIHKHYTYVNLDGVPEDYTLRAHHYFTTDIDTVHESEVFKFMDDAWHWYMAYMKWEDKNIDDITQES
jgi:hypothetical protein